MDKLINQVCKLLGVCIALMLALMAMPEFKA